MTYITCWCDLCDNIKPQFSLWKHLKPFFWCECTWVICCCGCSYALFQLLPVLWTQFFTVCCWVICPTTINYWLLKTDTCANSCLCVFSGLNTTIWKWSELHTLLPVEAQQVQASRVNVVACVNVELYNTRQVVWRHTYTKLKVSCLHLGHG